MEFPVTRRIVAQLPQWIDELAAPLPTPQKRASKPTGFRWDYPIHNAEVVQLGKAVRMASGVTAALALADLGFTVECATILRTVSDFASEIIFLAEGLIEERMDAAQTKFVDDYFKPMPTSPDELAAREREYYVARKEIKKAHRRLATGAGVSGDELLKISAFLDKGYDSYVHGAYETAMELYSGETHRFMLGGHESERHRCVARTSVAGKLHEVVAALEYMAITRRLDSLTVMIDAARRELVQSQEESGAYCPDQ